MSVMYKECNIWNQKIKKINVLKFLGKSVRAFLKLILSKMSWQFFYLNHLHRVENFLLEPWLCWKTLEISFACPSVHMFFILSICLFIWLIVCPPVCLSLSPSLHLPVTLFSHYFVFSVASLRFSNFMHEVKVD